jgi:integrase
MSLKLVPPRVGKSPFWRVRGTYLGVHVDRTTKAGRKNVAIQVLKKIEGEIERREFVQPVELTFAAATLAYMKAGGERIYIRKLLEHFKETPVRRIDQTAIDAAAVSLYPNGSAATRNRQVYTPVSAVLRHVGYRLDLRRPHGSGGNRRTTWLWPEQAFALFKEAQKINAEFATLLIVLCYTGMRLSEALKLN